MSKILFPILAAVVLLAASVSADDKLNQLKKDAEAGKAEAQLSLGAMYHRGQGVAKDYFEALKWYRKAAEQGAASAQLELGLMYGNGQGVEKDYAEVYAWFNLVAANGNENAGKARDELENRMSPQQVADAQKRTKELKKLIADKKASGATPKTSN